MKLSILATALAAALCGAPVAHSAPVDAATVQAFVADCASRPEAQALDVCMSYVQGALDQIVLSSGNAECAAAFDRAGKPREVWERLASLAAHPLAGKESLWGSVRSAAIAAVPACAPASPRP